MNSTIALKAGRREWIGLIVLALPCMLYSMDLTVLNLAVPAMSAHLKPTSAQLLWIVDIYGFLVAGSLIIMGTLGDRIGRRKLLLLGATAFGLTSLLAAFSTSAEMLIVSRALLGIAGATLAPSTLSLIRNMFHDPNQRMTAIGIWGTSYAAGGAVGPLIGGVLLEYFWWGSVFVISVPVMVLLLILGPMLLPEFKDAKAGRVDLLSAAMSLVAVLGVIYGLKQIAQEGLGWLPVMVMLVGLTVGVLFVRRQQTLANPLLDLRLFSNRAFSASVAINTLGVFVVFGGFLYIAQYLQLVLGLSPLLAGLWSLPGAVAVIVTSNLAPIIVRRIRPAYVIGFGLVLTAVGYGLLTQVNAASALAGIVFANIIMSAGFGLVFILTSDMVIGAAPAERAGAASAISETGAEFGGALGIAVLGTIGTAVYRTLMADSMPADVPHAVAEIARDTLGGAVTVASQLPDQLGLTLLTASREAFTQGMHLTAWIATILMMSIAILTVTLLRNVQPGGHEEQPAHEHLANEHGDECDDEYFGNGCLEPVLVPIAVQDRR